MRTESGLRVVSNRWGGSPPQLVRFYTDSLERCGRLERSWRGVWSTSYVLSCAILCCQLCAETEIR